MLATHNPPALPERLPDSAHRVKRRHPGDCEPLPEKALDPTRLARQNGHHLKAYTPNPLTTTASFIETMSNGGPPRRRNIVGWVSPLAGVGAAIIAGVTWS